MMTAKLEKMAFYNFSKQSLNESGIIPRNRWMEYWSILWNHQ